MMSGLTRQALRRHPWSFIGPGITQCLGAAIVTWGLCVVSSIDGAPLDPAGRRGLVDSGLADAGALFLTVAVYLTAIVVGTTMSATIGQQARDIALARAVGATPGQVRRAIVAQAVVIAVPATLVGVPVGMFGGWAWIGGLVGHGAAPAAVTFQANPIALPVALAVTVGTSVLGALIASIRPSRVRAATALTEAAVPRRRAGWLRTVLGIVLLAGGVGLSIWITHARLRDAEAVSLFVMLAMCLGAGFLGPALLRLAAVPARRLDRLAADSVAAGARALSGALVPLLLATAFVVVQVAAQTTAAHHGKPATSAELWLVYTGTGIYAAYAAVAALNTLVTVVLSRRRELAIIRLAGATRAGTLRLVAAEAGIVVVVSLAAAAGVSGVTLVPMLGSWTPYAPAGYVVVGALAVAALVGLGTVLPAIMVTRRPAIETVGAAT